MVNTNKTLKFCYLAETYYASGVGGSTTRERNAPTVNTSWVSFGFPRADMNFKKPVQEYKRVKAPTGALSTTKTIPTTVKFDPLVFEQYVQASTWLEAAAAASTIGTTTSYCLYLESEGGVYVFYGAELIEYEYKTAYDEDNAPMEKLTFTYESVENLGAAVASMPDFLTATIKGWDDASFYVKTSAPGLADVLTDVRSVGLKIIIDVDKSALHPVSLGRVTPYILHKDIEFDIKTLTQTWYKDKYILVNGSDVPVQPTQTMYYIAVDIGFNGTSKSFKCTNMYVDEIDADTIKTGDVEVIQYGTILKSDASVMSIAAVA